MQKHEQEDLEKIPLVYHWEDGSFVSTDDPNFEEVSLSFVKELGDPVRVCLSSRMWKFFD